VDLRPRQRARRERERLGHEAPGSVLRGPPITITCECGEKRNLRYGAEWQCERCGKRWDTRQIPAEQYEAIRRLQWRFRVVPIALGVVVAALAIFFTLTGNIFNVFVLLPLAMMIWFVFLRPTHQRRYRQAISDLPRWELRPQ
jgi:Flp pilus assembly protein TadB